MYTHNNEDDGDWKEGNNQDKDGPLDLLQLLMEILHMGLNASISEVCLRGTVRQHILLIISTNNMYVSTGEEP